MEWKEIYNQLPEEEKVRMDAAAKRIDSEYYDKASPHYKDNERYSWAVNAIKSHYLELIQP